jgi:hypothetical protein
MDTGTDQTDTQKLNVKVPKKIVKLVSHLQNQKILTELVTVSNVLIKMKF